MLHQTPGETSPNILETKDCQVALRLLDSPHRFPESDYKVLVFRLMPKAHSRVRYLSNGIVEYLPTNEEISAFFNAFDQLQKANGKPLLKSGVQLTNKPEERKQYWHQVNAREPGQSRWYKSKTGRSSRPRRYVTNYRNN